MSFIHNIQNAIFSAVRFMKETQSRIRNIVHPSIGSLGVSGTDISGQYITDEYLPALQDLYTRCNFYDVMEKAEPAVRLALLTYKKPILSANWDVVIDKNLCEKEGIDEEFQQTLIDNVRYNLFERNKRRLQKQKNEMLQFKKYGFSIMEIRWGVEDGQLVLEDLEFRHPRTILWQIDKENQLLGVKQTNYYGNKKPEFIPRDKMLLFSQEDIGDNYEGISDLRYMYRPYLEKDRLKRIVMVALQKFGVGMPIITMSNNANDNDKEAVKDFVKGFNSFDQLGGILPFGWEKEILEGNFSGASLAMQFMDKLNAEILMAALAIFVLPTLKGSGSLALSKDASDFFGMALQADADLIADVINYELIPILVDYNFETKVYPYVKITISEQDSQQALENIRGAVKDGVLPVCEELQERVGSLLELEEIDWHEVNERQAEERQAEADRQLELAKMNKPETDPTMPTPPPDGKPQEMPDDEGDIEEKSESCGCGVNHLQEKAHWRELTDHEEAAGGVETMAEKKRFFDIEQKSFDTAVKPILDKQAAAVLKFSKTHTADEVMKFEVPDKVKYQKALQKYYETAALEGIRSLAKQAKKEIPSGLNEKVKNIATQRSMVLSERATSDLTFFVATKMLEENQSLKPEPINETVLKQENAVRAYTRFLDTFAKGM